LQGGHFAVAYTQEVGMSHDANHLSPDRHIDRIVGTGSFERDATQRNADGIEGAQGFFELA